MKKYTPKKRAKIRDELGDETAALTAAQLDDVLVENTPLLDTDDARFFRSLCAVLLDENPPQSILDQIDANDFAYNLIVETRCRRAIAATHAQSKTTFSNIRSFKTKKELRGELISNSDLEHLHKLAKLEDNYGRNRRAIGKDWRARAENRSRIGSSSPVQRPRIAVDQSPPLAPDREQADGGASQGDK